MLETVHVPLENSRSAPKCVDCSPNVGLCTLVLKYIMASFYMMNIKLNIENIEHINTYS